MHYLRKFHIHGMNLGMRAYLYMGFRTTEADLRVEEASSHGRSDMALVQEGKVFVLEFKAVERQSKAEEGLDSTITQIREREGPIHLTGMVFGRKERNLIDIRVEAL